MPCPDRLGRGDRDVDLRETLPLEAGCEGDQARVVPHRQRGDRRRVDAARQECADGDVGAHVLGHRILEHRGDLVVTALLVARGERFRGEPGSEVPGHLRCATGPHPGIAARLQPSHAAVERLGFGHVLQHRVVLDRAFVDTEVDAQLAGEVEKALLLAAHRGACRSGGHEERLDAERVARAEQFAFDGVPEREGEHAAQPGQRVGAPVVVGGDDRLAVAVGVELSAVGGRQLLAQLQIVVDLAVEDQHVTVRRLGGAPPQRLMAVRDVDDRQPVEAEHHLVVVPGARLVGTAVPHQMGGARHRLDQTCGDVSGRVGQKGQESAHGASMPNRPAYMISEVGEVCRDLRPRVVYAA